MKKAIATKWVAALRSGKYKKGRDALRPTKSKYCCLGVLCDILDPKGWTQDLGEEFSHGKDCNNLPEKLRTKAGMRSIDGAFSTVTGSHSLEKLNDNTNTSFKKIADLIEKNYKEL